jgi:hypothetical protein
MGEGVMKKLLIVAVLIGAAVLFRVYHLEQYFSLEYLKGSRGRFVALYAENRLAVLGGYTVVYILVAGPCSAYGPAW